MNPNDKKWKEKKLNHYDNKILFDERIQFKVSQQISFEAHIATPSGKVILK